MSGTETYLIWSLQKRAWWKPSRNGYSHQLSQAGRYARDEAIEICVLAARPCTEQRYGRLPEIPVPLADINAMMDAFSEVHPGGRQPWE